MQRVLRRLGQGRAERQAGWCAGVTVWELGGVHRGPWAPRFWSSPGCLFHHAYLPGYRASKAQFGRNFMMTIAAGPTGPEFQVGFRPARPHPGVLDAGRELHIDKN